MHIVPQNKDEFIINNLFYCCEALIFTHPFWYKFMYGLTLWPVIKIPGREFCVIFVYLTVAWENIFNNSFHTVTSSVNLFLSSKLMSIRCVFWGLLFRGCWRLGEAVDFLLRSWPVSLACHASHCNCSVFPFCCQTELAASEPAAKCGGIGWISVWVFLLLTSSSLFWGLCSPVASEWRPGISCICKDKNTDCWGRKKIPK